jgi:hypothetical protein
MVSIICYTNNTRTLKHSYFTSSQLLRQGNSSTTIFQSTDDVLSGSFYLVCTLQEFAAANRSCTSPHHESASRHRHLTVITDI